MLSFVSVGGQMSSSCGKSAKVGRGLSIIVETQTDFNWSQFGWKISCETGSIKIYALVTANVAGLRKIRVICNDFIWFVQISMNYNIFPMLRN